MHSHWLQLFDFPHSPFSRGVQIVLLEVVVTRRRGHEGRKAYIGDEEDASVNAKKRFLSVQNHTSGRL